MKKSLFQSGVLLHGGRCRTQYAAFLRSFSVVLFLLPLLFAHTAYGDINAELVQAAEAGNTAKVEQLFRKGADVDAKHAYGRIALMIVARLGRTEIVDILKQAGAQAETTADAKTVDSRTHSVAVQRQSDPVITTNPALERLTVPAGLLPDGCELAPGTGLPFGSPDISTP